MPWLYLWGQLREWWARERELPVLPMVDPQHLAPREEVRMGKAAKKFKLATRIGQVKAALDEAQVELGKPEASRDYAKAIGSLSVAEEMTAVVRDFLLTREVDERRAGL